MTEPWGPQQRPDWPTGLLGPAQPDVLPAAPGGSGPVRKALLVGAAGLATAAVAGTAWATMSFLSGGGLQPEDVLPAGTLAMAKVDLDPAAGQKLAVYQLAKKFPSTSDDVIGADGVKDELLRALFEDGPDLDYARDVEPWVGDRAAVAAVPVAGATPEPLAAVAFTDRDAASDALGRLSAAADEADPMHYAFSRRGDYVLIGASQQVVDDAAGAGDVLADQERYASAVDELDGDQLVTAWADLDAVWQALPEEDRAAATGAEQLQPSGRVVVGGRAVDEGIEVVGRALALRTGSAQGAVLGSEPGTGMVAALPEGTVAAIGATGVGDAMVELYDQLSAAGDPLGLTGTSDALGLQLPDDLRVVLGQELVAAAFGPEEFAGRSRTDDPDRAGTLVEQLITGAFGFGTSMPDVYVDEGYGSAPPAEALPPSSPDLLPPEEIFVEEGQVTSGSIGFRGQESPSDMVRVLGDGIAVGSNPSALDKVSGDDGGLGGSPQFDRAVPDHGDAGMVLFVDIARALELFGDDLPAEDRADLEVLEAFGATSTGGENGIFRMRLTVR